jgi:hypothetical protein
MLRQPGFEPSDDGDVWGFYWGGGYIDVDSQLARTDDGLAYAETFTFLMT